MRKTSPVWKNLQRFANDHKLILADKGECGFGRPCVGFNCGGYWLDYNPCNGDDYKPIEEMHDDRLHPPNSVPDAYHKHDCFAVLVYGDDYDKALRQLNKWIQHIEKQGKVEVKEFPRKNENPIQIMLSGLTGKALVFVKEE